LQQMIMQLQQQLSDTEQKHQRLLEQFRLAQNKRFGANNEGHPGQGELFNEAESLADEADTETQDNTTTVTYERKQSKRQSLPKDLPRERIVHDIDDADKVCECCAGALHHMGDEISEKLTFIPAQVKVIEHVRPKYAHLACEDNGTRNQIKQAPMPSAIIPKGYATPSLLAQVITSKYQYGLPLYRQESMFKQYGIDMSRKTLSDWMLRCSDKLQLLYDRLKVIQLEQPVIHAMTNSSGMNLDCFSRSRSDDLHGCRSHSTVNVVGDNNVKSYMWLYATGADSPKDTLIDSDIRPIVLFDYHNSRASRCTVEYLDGYQGYLQVDGYAGYHHTQATLVGCWAHARRKFHEAKIAQGKKPSGKADMALSTIQKLYRIETQIKSLSIADRYKLRQEKSLPILEKFKQWLYTSEQQVLPKTKLGEAIFYTLNQWDKLITYTHHGQLNIDNNRAERCIKPFVIGRKNWLFSQTAKGAHASAVLYSVIETAKANGIIPFDYLMHVLSEIHQPDIDIDTLLPWNVSLD
jgi:transposase